MTDLELRIKEYAQKYYEGNPEITDEAFDRLVEELRAQNPDSELLTKTGWGYEPTSSPLKKTPHDYSPMTGISNKTTPSKFKHDGEIILSTKLDGASVGLYYEEGHLRVALTRGDGMTGLDITDKLKHLVPTTIPSGFTGRIRGEFVIPNETFTSKYDAKSPRNTAAGFLNQKDWDVTQIKDFKFIAYTVTTHHGYDVEQEAGYNLLKYFGFETVNYVKIDIDLTDETADKILENLMRYGDQTIACDGFVTAINHEFVAIKWTKDTEITEVTNIRWQVSRLGKLTPVVEFNPVDLCGATLSNVSGFNYKYIEENQIGRGTLIEITRSGDVIPYITQVIESKGCKLPTVCPECGSPICISGVDATCINPYCSATVIEKIKNFVFTVCNINGLGSEIITKFVEYYNFFSLEEFVNRCTTITTTELYHFVDDTPGFSGHVLNLLRDMVASLTSKIPADVLLCGIGLPGIGEVSAKKFFSRVTVSEFLDMLYEDSSFLDSGLNITGRKSLTSHRGIVMNIFNLLNVVDITEQEQKSQMLVCITGKLSVSRKAFVEELSKYNIVESSINKAQVLITDNPNSSSSKNIYANEHNIPKMSELDFRAKYMN